MLLPALSTAPRRQESVTGCHNEMAEGEKKEEEKGEKTMTKGEERQEEGIVLPRLHTRNHLPEALDRRGADIAGPGEEKSQDSDGAEYRRTRRRVQDRTLPDRRFTKTSRGRRNAVGVEVRCAMCDVQCVMCDRIDNKK